MFGTPPDFTLLGNAQENFLTTPISHQQGQKNITLLATAIHAFLQISAPKS